MADYIYLLETRLSTSQQAALLSLRELAKNKGLTLFLVGGAVRDLTSGSPVRDLDVAVQGNALKLRKDLEKLGAIIAFEHEPTQSLFLRFPGNVRVEVSSTLSITYPKPGKPVSQPATILEDLRSRDFTANAMAISLNEGSFGLLMDPLNGVADIENRQLRLVNNYGFIEDPVRMIRAARFSARLGWTMDERTQARYDTGKQEGYISLMTPFQRGYELEEIFHEEDPVRIIRRLESEDWLKHLSSALSSSRINTAELDRLRETSSLLQMQGIHPDPAAANFPFLTARLSAKELEALKGSFPDRAFVAELDTLDQRARDLAAQLTAKSAAAPSQAWKLIYASGPETLLWLSHTTKSPTLQAKFKSFHTEWPQARQKLPYTLMQEMRITPELPVFDQLLEDTFFEIMDGRLSTTEELKAFLEPHSPPAPPPPVNLRRARASKKEARPSRARKKAATAEVEDGLPEVLTEMLAEGSVSGETEQTPEAQSAPAAPPAAAKKRSPVPTAKAVPVPSTPAKVSKQPTPSAAKASGKSAEKSVAKSAPKPASTSSRQPSKAVSKQPAKASAKQAPRPVGKAKAPARALSTSKTKGSAVASKAPVKRPKASPPPAKSSSKQKPPAKAAAKGRSQAPPKPTRGASKAAPRPSPKKSARPGSKTPGKKTTPSKSSSKAASKAAHKRR